MGRKYMNKLLKHQLANLQIKVQLRKMILLKILTKIPMRKLKKSRKLRKTSKLRKSNKKKLQKKNKQTKKQEEKPKNVINSMYGEDEEDTDEEIEKIRVKQETDIKQEKVKEETEIKQEKVKQETEVRVK